MTAMQEKNVTRFSNKDFANPQSLNSSDLKYFNRTFAPEVFGLMKTDYAVRGWLTFAQARLRTPSAGKLRKAVFTYLIIQVSRHFEMKRRHLPFYVAEDVGRSGEHFHFHFGIAKHPAINGREAKIAEFIQTSWTDGMFLPDGSFASGRCEATEFDNSRKADGVPYDCKREKINRSLKEPSISKELMRRLKNN
jgi:hypothetical protein